MFLDHTSRNVSNACVFLNMPQVGSWWKKSMGWNVHGHTAENSTHATAKIFFRLLLQHAQIALWRAQWLRNRFLLLILGSFFTPFTPGFCIILCLFTLGSSLTMGGTSSSLPSSTSIGIWAGKVSTGSWDSAEFQARSRTARSRRLFKGSAASERLWPRSSFDPGCAARPTQDPPNTHQRLPKVPLKTVQRPIQELHPRPTQDLAQTYPRPTQNLPKTYPKTHQRPTPSKDPPKTVQRPTKDRPKTHQRPSKDPPKTAQRPTKDPPKTAQRPTKDHYERPARPTQDLAKNCSRPTHSQDLHKTYPRTTKIPCVCQNCLSGCGRNVHMLTNDASCVAHRGTWWHSCCALSAISSCHNVPFLWNALLKCYTSQSGGKRHRKEGWQTFATLFWARVFLLASVGSASSHQNTKLDQLDQHDSTVFARACYVPQLSSVCDDYATKTTFSTGFDTGTPQREHGATG